MATLVGLGVVAGLGWWWFESHRAAPGEPCTARYGCTEGSDCMAFSNGLVPPIGASDGICMAQCSGDSSCGPGQACRRLDGQRYCVAVVASGDPCGGEVQCVEGAECLAPATARTVLGTEVRPTTGSSVCRQECSGPLDDSCPAQTQCQMVDTSPLPSMPMRAYYCL